MNRKYKVFQVDSFTDKMFSGNPAGVVVDADGLSENEMQMMLFREIGRFRNSGT